MGEKRSRDRCRPHLGAVRDSLHGLQDEAVAGRRVVHGGLAEGGGDELGLGRAVLHAELLDQGDEVLLVVRAQAHVTGVLIELIIEDRGAARGRRRRGRAGKGWHGRIDGGRHPGPRRDRRGR